MTFLFFNTNGTKKEKSIAIVMPAALPLVNIEETIIIEDSGVGVKAASSAGVRALGLTAGKHWHSNRDKNELFDNGALNVFSDYESLGKAIEEL